MPKIMKSCQAREVGKDAGQEREKISLTSEFHNGGAMGKKTVQITTSGEYVGKCFFCYPPKLPL
jgi:hypothetical protein